MSESVQLINAVFHLHKLINERFGVNLGHRDVVDRYSIVEYEGVKCLEIDFQGMCHDAQPCNHQHLAPATAFHGTKNLKKALKTRCVMKDAKSPLKKQNGNGFYEGWYHAPSFKRACRYAKPHKLGRAGEFKPILKFKVV